MCRRSCLPWSPVIEGLARKVEGEEQLEMKGKLAPLEPQSRFGDKLLENLTSLSPKRDCGSKRVIVERWE